MNQKLLLNRKENGITLIALVITIIVLLILAGVAISMLSGENGILKQAANAKTETEKQSTLEQIKLAALGAMTNVKHKIESADSLETAIKQQGLNNATAKESAPIGYIVKVENEEYRVTNNGQVNPVLKLEGNQGKVLNEKENTLVKDENGNIVLIPAGFGVIAGDTANTAAKGLVISDDFENGTSTGNEFVWIPVGDVYTTTDEEKTESNTKTITLARYAFNSSNGNIMGDRTQTEPNGKLYTVTSITETSYYYTDSEAGEFKTSAIKNGGYYIGRYEAGDAIATANGTARSSATEGALVCKFNQQVYNYITRTNAKTKSEQMYNNSNFTSNLINSYAWDTAILFIQKMSGSNRYAIQKSLNTGSPKTTGESEDVQYNIYDMASNVMEWSTETYSFSVNPCVCRGGYYKYGMGCTSERGFSSGNDHEMFAFRPLLYM